MENDVPGMIESKGLSGDIVAAQARLALSQHRIEAIDLSIVPEPRDKPGRSQHSYKR